MQRENDVGFVVRRLSNLIKRDVENGKTRLGLDSLSSVNGWAIGYFYDNMDIDIFQKDFENKFSIRPSTASQILKTMEHKDLIKRVSVNGDARLKKIILTDKAIEIHKKITNEIADRENRLKKGISDTELKTFFSVMERLSANMEDSND